MDIHRGRVRPATMRLLGTGCIRPGLYYQPRVMQTEKAGRLLVNARFTGVGSGTSAFVAHRPSLAASLPSPGKSEAKILLGRTSISSTGISRQAGIFSSLFLLHPRPPNSNHRQPAFLPPTLLPIPMNVVESDLLEPLLKTIVTRAP